MKRKGIPIVISAPSGGGKSTIATQLVSLVPHTVSSISCTTRSPRLNEKEGVHYFFTKEDDFKQKIKSGEFLEWAEVHGNYYGTPRSYFDKQLAEGKDVLLTIDVQGALAVKRVFPDGVYVFLVPPSWDELKKRLGVRNSDDAKALEIRLANARKELSYLSHYDYLVVNDQLETAVADVAAIIRSEHCRLARINQRDIDFFA